MFKSIWEDTKREYNAGNMLTRLVLINTGAFIAINLVNVFLVVFAGFKGDTGFQDIANFFSVSSDWLTLVTHPWTILTHMFLHVGFFHFLFNMLFLYWFGRIVQDLIGNHRILPLYLISGLFGFVIYFVFANILYPEPVFALGASAAVMGTVIAAAFIAPEYQMNLILLGPVRLKYIAFALVLIDIFGIGSNINTGGHFAHLGGAFMGGYFVYLLQNGTDLSEPVNKILKPFGQFFSRFRGAFINEKSKLKVVHKQKKRTSDNQDDFDVSHQEKLDEILEKIKETGYDNLTEEEKEFLFMASKK